MALKMEKDVTGAMKNMIDICSSAGQDDPHAADWLTGTWLEEQLQGQRSLAGLINTFNNFKWDILLNFRHQYFIIFQERT